MKAPKLLAFLMLFVLLTSASFAVLDDADLYYSFDDDDNVGSDPTDLSGNGYDGTNNGAATGGTGIILQSFDFDGSNDYLDTGYDMNETWSISVWADLGDSSVGRAILGVRNSAATAREFQLGEYGSEGTVQADFYNGGTGNAGNVACSGYSAAYHHIVLTRDGDDVELYVDGTSCDTDSTAGKGNASVDMTVGRLGSQNAQYWDGDIDELGVYNRVLSSGEVSALYNAGAGLNPYTPEVGNYSYPKVSEATQIALETISSTTYVPVISGTVEVLNTTNISVSATAYVTGTAGLASEVNCSVQLDSVDLGETATSPTNSLTKSIGLLTGLVEKVAGNYTVELLCKKDGTKNFDIEGGELIITEYIDENENAVPVQENTLSANITSSSYQVLGTFNFTTSDNDLNGTEFDRFFLTESGTTNAYDSTGTICLRGEALGINSSEYCRYGAAGSQGSGAAFEFHSNVSENTTIEVILYGKSTTSDGHVVITVLSSEIQAHPEEANSTRLQSLNVTSTGYTTVASMLYTNNHHLSTTAVVKGGFSAQSNSGSADSSYRITVSGDATLNGSIIERSFTAANQEGLVSLQDVFPDLAQGNYTINLQALASNSDVTITDGRLTVFPATNIAFKVDNYTVTLTNAWDGTSLTDFEVRTDEGITYTDGGTGAVVIIASQSVNNLTIAKSGYVNRTILNHNTNLNLSATIGQSEVHVEATTYLGLQSVLNWTLATNQGSFNTGNGTVVIEPNLGNYTWNFSGITHYNSTNLAFEVASSSENFTIVGINDSYARFVNDFNGNPVNFSNVTILYTNGTSYQFQTNANGIILFAGYRVGSNNEYTVILEEVEGYETPVNFSVNTSSLPSNITYNISTISLNINIYFRTNQTLFTKEAQVIVEGQSNLTTSNGTLTFQDIALVSGNYTARVFSEGYYTEAKVFSTSGREQINLDFYLLETDNNNSGTLTIRTIDQFNRAVQGSTVSLQEYDEVSKSYVEVSQCISNPDGECKFLVEINTKTYLYSGFKYVNGLLLTDAITIGETFQNDVIDGETVAFDEQIRELILRVSDTFEIDTNYYLRYNVTESFNSATNESTIIVYFSTTDGSSVEMCVDYYTVQFGIETTATNGTYCVTGASGTLTPTTAFALNGTKNYVAKITAGGRLLQAYYYNGDSSIEKILRDGALLNPFFLFLWIAVVALSLYANRVPIFSILAIILAWGQVALFPTLMLGSVAAGITIIATTMIYIARKREDFE